MNQSGWICPNCNRANAPWMPYCCRIEIATTDDTLQLCHHGIPVKFGSCQLCEPSLINKLDKKTPRY